MYKLQNLFYMHDHTDFEHHTSFIFVRYRKEFFIYESILQVCLSIGS